jgi:uncharacterized protein YjbI with pentapeptide repeats
MSFDNYLQNKNPKVWLDGNKVTFFYRAALLIGFLLICIDFKTNNLFSADFWNNVLVEAHGMYLDILLFGIILTRFERASDTHHENKRWQEEITDFQKWNEAEAMFRIVGNIKRLVRNGITNIDLEYCYLAYANLQEVNLRGCQLTGTNLKNADLSFTDLSNAMLIGVDFSGAMLAGVNFQNSKCDISDFEGAFLGGANFMGVDLSSCGFENAKFNSATILENAFISDPIWFEKQKETAVNFETMIEKYIIDIENPIQNRSSKLYRIVRNPAIFELL